VHNLAFLLGLVADARAAVADGSFGSLRATVQDIWREPARPHRVGSPLTRR